MEHRPPHPPAAKEAGEATHQLCFEAMYREHADYVHNLAYRLTGQPGEADDLLQDTFLRAYRYLDGFAGGSLKSWLRRITINLFINHTRTRGRETPVSLQESTDDVGLTHHVRQALVDDTADPGAQLDALTLDGRLQKALDALPPEYRSVLVLREIDDLSYDQIAQALAVPIGTVRSRLARARTMLRERLGEARGAR